MGKEKEAWQSLAEIEVSAEPCFVASDLKRDTRYRFRVCAVNQAGVGDAAEVEVLTAPGAPGLCGQPRLASCCQQVLTIEWTPPKDDGGSPIVRYGLVVRPFSAMCANDSAYSVDGEVRHIEGEATQRADVHTDELNPSVGRYLCSVFAINAAEKVGPPTPDMNALPFPNPCAVCGPSPQALASFPDVQMQMPPNYQAMGIGQQMGYGAEEMHHELREPQGYVSGFARSPQMPDSNAGLLSYQQEIPPETPQLDNSMAAYGAGYGQQEHIQHSARGYAVPLQEAPDYDPPPQRSAPAFPGDMRKHVPEGDYHAEGSTGGWDYQPNNQGIWDHGDGDGDGDGD